MFAQIISGSVGGSKKSRCGECSLVTIKAVVHVIARSVLCDDREAYPKGKQFPSGQISLIKGRLLRRLVSIRTSSYSTNGGSQ